MIRGAQKRMIVIRTHDSRVFEEAYFVIRRDKDIPDGDNDMLTEADRIIRHSTQGIAAISHPITKKDNRRRLISKLAWLIGGFLLGSGCTALCVWLG